ncbi:MAG: hypothetical protein JRG96_18220, partial [Deltaproteobacteria bacterium]|nr:hypothetical protein [Deltaproteobacteria bacterium]
GPIDSSLPEDLGTILGSLQMGLMLDFEARKGRFGGYVAPIFVWLRDDDNSVQGHQIIVKESVYLIDFGLSYEVGQWRLWNRPSWVLPSPAVAVEPFFGARSLIDDITFTLEPGGSHRPEISFIAPVIGLRTFWDPAEVTDQRSASSRPSSACAPSGILRTASISGSKATTAASMWMASSRRGTSWPLRAIGSSRERTSISTSSPGIATSP